MGCIVSISDLTAQFLTSRVNGHLQIDWRRTAALCVFGTFYYGLIARKIYFVDESFFGPGRALLKATVDCSVHTPFLLIPCFYTITGAVKGQSLEEMRVQLRDEWWTASTASIAYWLPMMWLNF